MQEMNRMPSPSDGCRSRVYSTTSILSSRTCGHLPCVSGRSSASRYNPTTGWRTRRWSSTSRRVTCCVAQTIHHSRFTTWWNFAGTGGRPTGLPSARSIRPSMASSRTWRRNASQTASRYAFAYECNNNGNNRYFSFSSQRRTAWNLYSLRRERRNIFILLFFAKTKPPRKKNLFCVFDLFFHKESLPFSVVWVRRYFT